MNTKKKYTAPTSEVVNVEVQLMNGVSGEVFQQQQKSMSWDDNSDNATSADEAW